MLFLVPIVAAGAAYLTRDQSGSYDAGDGSRKIDCYQIWDQITHGPGPGSIENGQRAATRLKGSYEDRITTIDKLSRDMDAAWTGKGAAAAQNAGAHPMKAWMTDSGTKLADSDTYLGNQHNAFTTVAAKVQEVPQSPPDNGFLNSVTPWETDTDRAIEDYNRNGQANVDAFNEYFKASSENGAGLPTYSALDGSLAKVGVTEDGQNGKDKDGGGRDGTGRDGGTSDPGGSGSTPGNLPGGGGYQPGNLPGGGGYKPGDIPGPGGGNGGGYQPPNIPGGGNYQPGNIPGGGGYQPGNIPGYDGTKAAGYTPPNIPGPGSDYGSGGGFGPGGAGNLPGGPYGAGGAGGGFGPGGAGSLGGGFGPGSGSGGSLGAGSSTGSGGSPGSGAGMGRGGAGAAAAGGAGMGKAGGMGGMGMGGMGGARGGQGGEDEERTSKYLMGDDPNDIFGTDELTAPPVIGE
jgi:hypothetical protein